MDRVSKPMRALRAEMLGFIQAHISTRGYSPSIREVQAACGISSTSVVKHNLDWLCRHGHIIYRERIARGIALPQAPLAEQQAAALAVIRAVQAERNRMIDEDYYNAADPVFVELARWEILSGDYGKEVQL